MEFEPRDITDAEAVFGKIDGLLPAYDIIPEEFKRHDNRWHKWQSKWFFSGLECNPVPKARIDITKAMRHLTAIQASWAPKHEHKSAGVAYLASLWFESEGETKGEVK